MSDLVKQKKRKEYIKRNIPLLLMSAPCFIALFCFDYMPMFGLVMAFQNFTYRDGILGSAFVGLKNFEYIFGSGEIYRTLGNTMGYHLAMTVSITGGAIFLAIMLFMVRGKKTQNFFNTMTVTPYLVSYTVIAYIVFILLSNTGLINNALRKMGQNPIAWYTEASVWPYILVAVNMWFGVGIKAVYYFASLQSIDKALFEAAELDGANRWHTVWNIMLPSIAPTICIFLILDLGNLLASNFSLYYAVPMDSTALYSVTDVLSTYTYRGLIGGSVSTTTALGLFTGTVTTTATLLVNWVVKKISPESSLL